MKVALPLQTAILAISFVGIAFGAVDTTYEKLVLDEIEFNRQLKLEEKKIEVLARLAEFSAPRINVSSSSSSSSFQKNKMYTRNSSTQTTEVSQ